MKQKRELKNRLNNLATEREAMNILHKGRAWFWRERKAGRLRPTMIGGRVYYQTDQLLSLLRSDQQTAWERTTNYPAGDTNSDETK
jgi:hypothetical protein